MAVATSDTLPSAFAAWRNIEASLDKAAVFGYDRIELAPGQGHVDFRAVFQSLENARYSGWASIEILPQPDPDAAARKAINWLRPLVEDYNHA